MTGCRHKVDPVTVSCLMPRAPQDIVALLLGIAAVLAAFRWILLPMVDSLWTMTMKRCVVPVTDAVLVVFRTDRKDNLKAVVSELFNEELQHRTGLGLKVEALEFNVGELTRQVEANSALLEEIPTIRQTMDRTNLTMANVGKAVERLAEVLDDIRDDHGIMKGYMKARDAKTWEEEERRQEERRVNPGRRETDRVDPTQ